MRIEAYEDLVANAKIDKAINDAEKEFERDGVLLDVEEVLSGLRRKSIL